jgi:hypothetical protein
MKAVLAGFSVARALTLGTEHHMTSAPVATMNVSASMPRRSKRSARRHRAGLGAGGAISASISRELAIV